MINQSIDGYRLVRTVAESTRSSTVLGQPVALSGAPSEPVALTLYRSTASAKSVHEECDAMTRISSEHLVSVWDIASARDGSAVIVSEWIPGANLSKLLRARTYLTAGEAITILAPLADTLAQLHKNGVIHGNFGLDSVVFRPSGSPVIIGLTSAFHYEPERAPAGRSGDLRIQEDVQALTRVAAAVLSLVRQQDAASVRLDDFTRWLAETDISSSPSWAREFEGHLFGLGAPEPIRSLEPPESTVANVSLNSRVHSGIDGFAAQAVEPVRRRANVLGLSGWLHNEIESALRVGRTHLELTYLRLRRWVAPVRLRVWALGSVVLVAVVVALVSGALSPGVPEKPLELDSELKPFGQISTDGDLLPDAALRNLLLARESCLRDLSVECLNQVENADAPAYAADSVEIQRVLDGGELTPGLLLSIEGEVASQELGDSVLFTFGAAINDKPTSVLLVKGEAGWRIRSYTLPD